MPRSVEECWRILRQSGKSIGYESLAYVPEYSAWLEQQDWTDAYERHKANLQLIGLNDPEKRWVLKNPSHLVGLDAIMSVYPDALIVQTHRDPVVAIASACSLSAEATKGWSTTFVGETIGRTQLDMLSKAVERFERERAAYSPEQFVDVDYREFVGDPVGTTKGIYETLRPGVDGRRSTRRSPSSTPSRARAGGGRSTPTTSPTTGSPRTRCGPLSRPDRRTSASLGPGGAQRAEPPPTEHCGDDEVDHDQHSVGHEVAGRPVLLGVDQRLGEPGVGEDVPDRDGEQDEGVLAFELHPADPTSRLGQ